MEIRDFMTKENLEMIGLAVMCDRFPWAYRNLDKPNPKRVNSTSLEEFEKLVRLGNDINSVMAIIAQSEKGVRVKDIREALQRKDPYAPSSQRITRVCGRLVASGYLKHVYGEPRIIEYTIDTYDYEHHYWYKRTVTKSIPDSLYKLA
jgi:hypothetical protein